MVRVKEDNIISHSTFFIEFVNTDVPLNVK